MNRSTPQDTGKFRQNTKDQYYTRPAVAADCVARLLAAWPRAHTALWVEPSAGAGAFLTAFPADVARAAIDIEPAAAGIERADFLQWRPAAAAAPDASILVVGNPPFGRQGSAAKAFVQHAATFADCIAFILPRSFLKPSMTNAFPPRFHCIHSAELGPNSFEVNGASYDVPCVFQVWERRAEARPKPVAAAPQGFRYVTADQPYHIAFRRVGVNAGTAIQPAAGRTFSPQSHYFWSLEPALSASAVEKIVAALNAHTFPSNTTGPRSISKGEANEVMNSVLAALH